MKPLISQQNIVLIKIGGNALTNEKSIKSLAEVISHLKNKGDKIVLCHGGGSQISEAYQNAGEPVEFISGLRKTTAKGARIVKEVLCKVIQKNLIIELEKYGIFSVGLCGDDNLFVCEPKILFKDGKRVDLGFVGEVIEVHHQRIYEIFDKGLTPIVAAVGSDTSGNIYNINADTGAAFLASSIGAHTLVLVTDVDGLYSDWPNRNSLIRSIDSNSARKLLPSLDHGMAPKLEAAILAVDSDVSRVYLVNGNSDNSIFNLLVLDEEVGTKVSK